MSTVCHRLFEYQHHAAWFELSLPSHKLTSLPLWWKIVCLLSL